eukprot:Hpha_TRINITY_DN36456_c0_g1::TRINITY_DN36456_c0_g1_i1::g.20088::m.20088
MMMWTFWRVAASVVMVIGSVAGCSVPGSYRYIRFSNGGPLRRTYCTASWDLYEVEIKDINAATVPLSIHDYASPATDSAWNAIDGVLSTYYAADPLTYGLGSDCWSAAKIGIQYLVVDLGSVQSVGSIRMYHDGTTWT